MTSYDMILTMNNFAFNQEHYLQIHGTAMGANMAPSFANLFLNMFETNALTNAPWQPHIWWRYIDDIFMIWTEGSDRLKIFVDYLNNIHPTIKFTSSHSLTIAPFLEVMVSLHRSIIETDLFTKPTDKQQHLLSSSCHPHHTKKALPFSLALRLRRICHTDAKFKHRINELNTYLLARGYNNSFQEEQFLRAANIFRTNALQTKPKDSDDVVPFVVTYNPALSRISNILRKHFNILHSSNHFKEVFKQLPFLAYRRSPNLHALLVEEQLPVISNNHFPPGSFRCRQNVPLVHTLLRASQVIPFTLQVKHASALHTLLVTLKTWFNVTVVIYNILSDVSRTDLTNTDAQSPN